jgi:ubiquinol-cytochrome c reductase cytochrome b subunit
MFSALLVILVLSFTDSSKLKGLQFRPLTKIFFFVFIVIFFILMILGAKHVEDPFIVLGQITTVGYFSFFFLIYISSITENMLNTTLVKK